MIFLIIAAFFVQFYHGTDNAGITLGTENCHVGFEVQPKPALFALCYAPDGADKGVQD
jgi:hypothetical protein